MRTIKIIITLLGLALIFLILTSCEKQEDCNCDKLTYERVTFDSYLSRWYQVDSESVECQDEKRVELSAERYYEIKCW